jgi:hypothetical protein
VFKIVDGEEEEGENEVEGTQKRERLDCRRAGAMRRGARLY